MKLIKKIHLHTFILTFSIFISSNYSVFAQLTTVSASGITPQQLVQNMLLGTGVTVSNVKFNGSLLAPSASNQIGSFSTGSN
ncbi:MAG: hypothetical protein ACOYO1_19460, partial [Bacteroidales bacterium]